MIRANDRNYLLETGPAPMAPGTFLAWVSSPDRQVVGYGAGLTEADAVEAALRAWNTARTDVAASLRTQFEESLTQEV